MGTPKGINQKGKYTAMNARLNRYVLMVQAVYDACTLEAAKIAERTGYSAGDVPFRFADFPATKDAMRKLQSQFVGDIGAIIHRGTSEEWKQSNIVQDLLADKVLKFYGSKAGGEKHRVYYQTNSDALKAFQQRKISGEFHLSEILWNQSENYKTEMEYAISSALEKGTSAVTLSKRLSKYLNDFDRLKDDYKERYGKAVECEDCEYRSMRLARSEINMAYRTAEWTRWQQMDFVIGFDIKLSKSHDSRMPNGDVCNILAGRYPKTFIFKGWHPNCMCYVVPVLKDEDDFWADDDEPIKNEVTDVPDAFKLWVRNNEDRIENGKSLPYFLKDNPGWKDYLDLEYHRIEEGKFDKAFKDAEKSLKRQKYELMTILTPSGKTVTTQQGNMSNVYFDDATAKLAKNNIVVHNHPSGNLFPKEDFRSAGFSFSSDDLKEAVKCDMRSFVAVAKSYRYTIDRPANGWGVSPEEITKAYREVYNQIMNDYDLSKHPNYVNIRQHIVVKRLAKKFGFGYKYEKN